MSIHTHMHTRFWNMQLLKCAYVHLCVCVSVCLESFKNIEGRRGANCNGGDGASGSSGETGLCSNSVFCWYLTLLAL